MRAIEEFLAESRISAPDEITTALVESHLARLHERGLFVKTILNALSAITQFCEFLFDRGWLLRNPAKIIRHPHLPEEQTNYLTDDELAKALRAARTTSHSLYTAVVVAAYGGLRVSELRLLRWVDVQMDGRYLMVIHGKGGRMRKVWLHPLMVAALERHRAECGPWPYVWPGGRQRPDGTNGKGVWNRTGPRSMDWWERDALRPLQRAMPDVFNRLPKGTTGRQWHGFRHTFCSRVVAAGIAPIKGARWAGHKNLRTFERYTHLAPGYDSDIEKLT